MSNPSGGTTSKSKAGGSQPSESSNKRKRGVFQKECMYTVIIIVISKLLCHLSVFMGFIQNVDTKCVVNVTVQHMMYGFGDDPNVSSTI